MNERETGKEQQEVDELLVLNARLRASLDEETACVAECAKQTAELAQQASSAKDAAARFRQAAEDAEGLCQTLSSQVAMERAAAQHLAGVAEALQRDKQQQEQELVRAEEQVAEAEQQARCAEDAVAAVEQQLASQQAHLRALTTECGRSDALENALEAEQARREQLEEEQASAEEQVGVVERLLESLGQCRAELQAHLEALHVDAHNKEQVLRYALREGRKKVEALAAENEELAALVGETAGHMGELEEAVASHGSQFAQVQEELAATKERIAELEAVVAKAEEEASTQRARAVQSKLERPRGDAAGAEDSKQQQKQQQIDEQKQQIEQNIQHLHRRALSMKAVDEELEQAQQAVRQQEARIQELRRAIEREDELCKSRAKPAWPRARVVAVAVCALLSLCASGAAVWLDRRQP